MRQLIDTFRPIFE